MTQALLFKRLSTLATGCVLSLLLLTQGCQTVDSAQEALLGGGSRNQLEVPPDLTSVPLDQASSLPTALQQEASASELREFARFQQLADTAEYQEFLKWREENTRFDDITYEAFQRQRRELRRDELSKLGVIALRDSAGNRQLVVLDEGDRTWDRVKAAIENVGSPIISENRSAGVFTITIKPERKIIKFTGWSLGKENHYLELKPEDGEVLIRLYDFGRQTATSEEAGLFMQLLTNQLRTFQAPQPAQIAAAAAQIEPQGDGHIAALMRDPPDTAWRRVDLAIRDAGFSVEERNQNDGWFRIRYVDSGNLAKSEKKGFAKLAFWQKDDKAIAGRFDVRLEPVSGGTRLQVVDEDGARSDVTDQIVQRITEQLQS